jgi:hypothetical protein
MELLKPEYAQAAADIISKYEFNPVSAKSEIEVGMRKLEGMMARRAIRGPAGVAAGVG